MFENRARKRRRNGMLLIVVLILVIAFGFGYYLNYGGSEDIEKDKTTTQDNATGYRIPDNIKNPSTAGGLIANADPGTLPEQSATANPNKLITASTKVIFKTYFTLCSHMLDKDAEDIRTFINMDEQALQSRYPDWTVSEFSSQQVILKREIQTYCPRHFIIGSKDGFIAIYVYSSDGVKNLYQLTDSPISVLTTEDQRNLEYGIVADSEEELQQKLEGLGD